MRSFPSRPPLLHVFHTCIGHSPERILLSTLDTENDWSIIANEIEILKPELRWEGADVKPEPSRPAESRRRVHQLRDPYIFRDVNEETGEEELFMYYAGGGESGIGVVRLQWEC